MTEENGVEKRVNQNLRRALLLLLAPAILQAAGPRISTALTSSSGKVTAIVKFAPGLPTGEPDRLLQEYGAQVLQNPDLLPDDRLIQTDVDGLAALAALPEALSIYPASMEMIAGVPVLGCPGSLMSAEDEADSMFQSIGGWFSILNGSALNWSIPRPTHQMPEERLKAIIERALAEWSRPVQLSFQYNPHTTERTLAFSFLTGYHGDAYPFDGKGGYLAHAFYPPPWNQDPIAGDLHFDDDETWTEGGNPDPYSVILHELGHALGLQHIDKPGSVMYPYYRNFETLQPQDIEALRRLFPARVTPVEPAETPVIPPPGTTPIPGVIPPLIIPPLTIPPLTIPPFSIDINQPAPVSGPTVDVSGTVTGAIGSTAIVWSTGAASGKAEGANWKAIAIPLAVGNNTATFTASDAGGRKATKTITLARVASGPAADSVAPTLTIKAPFNTVYSTSAASLKISGTARDSAGVKEIRWQRGATNGLATGTTSWSFQLPLNVGDNHVIVKAADAAGNTSWRSLLITRR